jgi:hypothetical protein
VTLSRLALIAHETTHAFVADTPNASPMSGRRRMLATRWPLKPVRSTGWFGAPAA